MEIKAVYYQILDAFSVWKCCKHLKKELKVALNLAIASILILKHLNTVQRWDSTSESLSWENNERYVHRHTYEGVR